jgi:hypothetical protein
VAVQPGSGGGPRHGERAHRCQVSSPHQGTKCTCSWARLDPSACDSCSAAASKRCLGRSVCLLILWEKKGKGGEGGGVLSIENMSDVWVIGELTLWMGTGQADCCSVLCTGLCREVGLTAVLQTLGGWRSLAVPALELQTHLGSLQLSTGTLMARSPKNQFDSRRCMNCRGRIRNAGSSILVLSAAR